MLDKLKKIKFKNFIYPIISLVLLVVIVISFISVTKFLSQNINKAFLDESEIAREAVRVDLESLKLVEKKLGL